MNEFETPAASVLDRLVDGELSAAERREVLVALDREDCSENCGWRRLALAYLEAQTLRQQLRRIAQPGSENALIERGLSSSTHSVPAVVISRKVSQIAISPAWQWSVAAICCLMAFGLGRQSSMGLAKTMGTEKSKPAASDTFAPTPTLTGSSDDRLAAMRSAGEETQETLRLVLDDLLGGPPQTVDVPLVNNSEIDPSEFLTGPPSVPLSVRQALLREGRVVHEERQLVEVELSDGRRGVVPISDVSVINAGSDVFQ